MDAIKPDFNFNRFEEELLVSKDNHDLMALIVNAPFAFDKVATALIFLGIVVFLLVSDDTQTIDRLSLTTNEFAQATLNVTSKKFEDIKIPTNDPKNIIAEAIRKQIVTKTGDWASLFTPELTPDQARINQASAGIAYSSVYPLIGVKNGGALIFSFYQYPEKIGPNQVDFMEQYASLVSKVLRSRW